VRTNRGRQVRPDQRNDKRRFGTFRFGFNFSGL